MSNLKIRLKISFSKNTENVPIDAGIVTSWLHKLIGNNNSYHNNKSSYSVSSLLGGTRVNNSFETFKNGAELYISSEDTELISRILIGGLEGSTLGYGMNYIAYEPMPIEVTNGNSMYFVTNKYGIALKDVCDNKFYTLDDSDFLKRLIEQTKRKLKGIDPEVNIDNFDLEIIDNKLNKTTYHRKQNKKTSKFFKIKTSTFTFKVTGNRRIFEILMIYGLGNMTGSGFGLIYDNKDWKKYNQKEYNSMYSRKEKVVECETI